MKRKHEKKNIKMGRNQSIGLYGKMNKFYNLFKFCLIKTFNKRYYQPKKKNQKIESSDNLINKHCNFLWQ